MAQSRLVRPVRGRLLAGVCVGIGARLGIDPWLVRLGFILAALLHGMGAVIYLGLWLVTPRSDSSMRRIGPIVGENLRIIGDLLATSSLVRSVFDGPKWFRVVCVAAIIVGVSLLAGSLGLLSWRGIAQLWAVTLVVAGVAGLLATEKGLS